MILYTTVPQDLIFPTEQSEFDNQKVVDWQGIPLLVQQVEERYKVVRIMSCDPNHFLDDTISPGQFLN